MQQEAETLRRELSLAERAAFGHEQQHRGNSAPSPVLSKAKQTDSPAVSGVTASAMSIPLRRHNCACGLCTSLRRGCARLVPRLPAHGQAGRRRSCQSLFWHS